MNAAPRKAAQAIGEVFALYPQTIDADLLVGRRAELIAVLQALQVDGTCPVIHGQSGIGKTLLSAQVQLAASGNTAVLDTVNAAKYGFDADDYCETFRVHLYRDGLSPTEMIAGELRRWLTDAQQGERRDVEREMKVTLGMAPKVEMGRKSKPKAYDEAKPNTGATEETVLDLATQVCEKCTRRVVVFVDGLGPSEETARLGDLVAAASTATPTELRFVLVGTAAPVKSLFPDNDRIGRYLAPVELNRLPDTDLSTMLNKRLERLHALNVCARFGPGLLRSLVTIANGIPSLAVQLARDTVLAAEREGLTKIARKHLDEVLRDLVTHLRTTS